MLLRPYSCTNWFLQGLDRGDFLSNYTWEMFQLPAEIKPLLGTETKKRQVEESGRISIPVWFKCLLSRNLLLA